MKNALPEKDYGPVSNIQPLSIDDVEYIRVKQEFLKMLEKTLEKKNIFKELHLARI